MRDREEEKRLTNRIMGIWGIGTILLAAQVFISVMFGRTRAGTMFTILSIVIALGLVWIIFFITRKEK